MPATPAETAGAGAPPGRNCGRRCTTPAEIAGAGAPPRQEPTYTGHEPQILTFLSGVQCVSRG